MIFGQTPRDIAEKNVQVYVHQPPQPYSVTPKAPNLSNIHETLKVCPFIPPKELHQYKLLHSLNSDKVRALRFFTLLSLSLLVSCIVSS